MGNHLTCRSCSKYSTEGFYGAQSGVTNWSLASTAIIVCHTYMYYNTIVTDNILKLDCSCWNSVEEVTGLKLHKWPFFYTVTTSYIRWLPPHEWTLTGLWSCSWFNYPHLTNYDQWTRPMLKGVEINRTMHAKNNKHARTLTTRVDYDGS